MNINLKVARIRKGLNQTEVARLLGVHRQTVYGWEMGEKCPNRSNMIKLAQLFNTSVDELFFSGRNDDNGE